MSFFKPSVSFSLNIALPFSVMTHNSSVTFSLKHFIPCTENSLKVQSAKCSGEVNQIPQVIHETASHFSFKVFIDLQYIDAKFCCTFLTQILYTLVKRGPLKYKF